MVCIRWTDKLMACPWFYHQQNMVLKHFISFEFPWDSFDYSIWVQSICSYSQWNACCKVSGAFGQRGHVKILCTFPSHACFQGIPLMVWSFEGLRKFIILVQQWMNIFSINIMKTYEAQFSNIMRMN